MMKIKMKLKTNKDKTTKWEYSAVSWFTCPHCKKIVFLSTPETVKQLKKWKRQKSPS